MAQRYGFDPNAEMPENARLAKQRELSEEYLAAKAEEMAEQLRAGIESAEVSKWRKFLAKIRRALEKFLPREKLNELDDRTLTDLLRKSLANTGYQIDVDGKSALQSRRFDKVKSDRSDNSDESDAERGGAFAKEGRAAVGDTFGTIRRNVVPEVGKTPLFEKKFRSFSDIALDLFEIYNSFPESVTAADGKTVFVRNKQNDRDSARLFHLVASNDANNGNRNTIEIVTKVPWITRIPETLENAQVKLKDSKSQNYIYARAYTDGYWHFVVVSKSGVVIGGNSYQHGLITQFAEDHNSNRDNFSIVWESYGKVSKQPNRAHDEESQGYAPISSPGNDNNISSSDDLSSDDLKKSGRGSVSGLWHGSAADFEKPSLQFVGTGEGNQVFGWGFYATDQKEIGKQYVD